MRAQLKAEAEETLEQEGESTAANFNHDYESAPAAKRRRLASFFADPPAGGCASGAEGESAAGGSDEGAPEVVVALRKGNIVATAFHPELTNDSRWHEYFIRMVREAAVEPVKLADAAVAAATAAGVESTAGSSAVETVAA